MEDREDLLLIVDELHRDSRLDLQIWKENLSASGWKEEKAWVLDKGRRPIGYARVDEIPGLEGALELNGFVAPAEQRKGHGTILLRFVIEQLIARGAKRLHHATSSQQSAAYLFLTARAFYLEHVERFMELDQAGLHLIDSDLSAEYSVKPYKKHVSISQFLRLYDDCFEGHPWYQPYDLAEVAGVLQNPADLLFLYQLQEPIGFCWIHYDRLTGGVIEPFGILPQFQGRGLGAFLLKSGLNRLHAMGAYRVQIGAWDANQDAINLYTKIGFRDTGTQTHLALDL